MGVVWEVSAWQSHGPGQQYSLVPYVPSDFVTAPTMEQARRKAIRYFRPLLSKAPAEPTVYQLKLESDGLVAYSHSVAAKHQIHPLAHRLAQAMDYLPRDHSMLGHQTMSATRALIKDPRSWYRPVYNPPRDLMRDAPGVWQEARIETHRQNALGWTDGDIRKASQSMQSPTLGDALQLAANAAERHRSYVNPNFAVGIVRSMISLTPTSKMTPTVIIAGAFVDSLGLSRHSSEWLLSAALELDYQAYLIGEQAKNSDTAERARRLRETAGRLLARLSKNMDDLEHRVEVPVGTMEQWFYTLPF